MAIVIAALAGPQWLFTEEKLPNSNYNGTANFNALDDGAYITKYTKSSLWILCTTLPGECSVVATENEDKCGAGARWWVSVWCPRMWQEQ